MVREGKPEGFFYLDHRTVESKHNFIKGHIRQSGNVHDAKPYLARLKWQKERFGFDSALKWKPWRWKHHPMASGVSYLFVQGELIKSGIN
jgi:hypothetical protein